MTLASTINFSRNTTPGSWHRPGERLPWCRTDSGSPCYLKHFQPRQLAAVADSLLRSSLSPGRPDRFRSTRPSVPANLYRNGIHQRSLGPGISELLDHRNDDHFGRLEQEELMFTAVCSFLVSCCSRQRLLQRDGQIDPNRDLTVASWRPVRMLLPRADPAPSANFGQGDVDTTNNLVDFCTTSGWTMPPSAGSVVASINGSPGSFTFTGSGVSCSSTTCTFAGTSPSNGTVQTGTFDGNESAVWVRGMNCSSACTVHLPASGFMGFAVVAIMCTGCGRCRRSTRMA